MPKAAIAHKRSVDRGARLRNSWDVQHKNPKRQRTAALHDASRERQSQKTPKGSGLRQSSAALGWVVGILIVLSMSCAAADYDLLIRNAKVIDGTGNPWFYGDVAVKGDRIAQIGGSDGTAKREIDAKGLAVAPGFIDMHSHSDFVLLEDGNAESKIRQGVTTEILGEGTSAGPTKGKLVAHPVSVGNKKAVIRTLGEYLETVERAGVSVNVASYVAAGSVWQCVMGQSFERPRPAQLNEMKDLVAEAMREGAFGLSTALMMPPGSLATTADLIEFSKVVRGYDGIYSSHIRDEGLGIFDSVKEAITIGEQAGVAVDILHLKIADQQYWGRMNEVVGMIEAARKRGVNVQANIYPYTRGNNDLSSIIPPWAHEGGRSEMIARLKDPALRPRLKRDIENGLTNWYNHYTAVGRDWSRILISANNAYKGKTMDQVIAAKEADPLDLNRLRAPYRGRHESRPLPAVVLHRL